MVGAMLFGVALSPARLPALAVEMRRGGIGKDDGELTGDVAAVGELSLVDPVLDTAGGERGLRRAVPGVPRRAMPWRGDAVHGETGRGRYVRSPRAASRRRGRTARLSPANHGGGSALSAEARAARGHASARQARRSAAMSAPRPRPRPLCGARQGGSARASALPHRCPPRQARGGGTAPRWSGGGASPAAPPRDERVAGRPARRR